MKKTIIKLPLRTNWDWKSAKGAAADSTGTLHNEPDRPRPASVQVLHYHAHQGRVPITALIAFVSLEDSYSSHNIVYSAVT